MNLCSGETQKYRKRMNLSNRETQKSRNGVFRCSRAVLWGRWGLIIFRIFPQTVCSAPAWWEHHRVIISSGTEGDLSQRLYSKEHNSLKHAELKPGIFVLLSSQALWLNIPRNQVGQVVPPSLICCFWISFCTWTGIMEICCRELRRFLSSPATKFQVLCCSLW